MSNLQSAKAAIKAEIDHARQGLDFYRERVEVLEQTLARLDEVSVPQEGIGRGRGRKAADSQPAGGKSTRGGGRKRRAAAADGGDADLPYTGGDYWLNLVGGDPRTAAEILRAAIDSLGFTPSKAQVQKLRQRLTAALQLMLQAKKIQDNGSGRERRYFRPQ